MALGVGQWWNGALKRPGPTLTAGLTLALATMAGCQAPPRVAMAISPGFNFHVERTSFRKGASFHPEDAHSHDQMTRDMYRHDRAQFPTGVLSGQWLTPAMRHLPSDSDDGTW